MKMRQDIDLLFILAGLGLVAWWFLTQRNGGNGGGNGNGNGDPPPSGGLRLNIVTNPQFIASGDRGVDIVGPGGELRINLSRVVATNNFINVTNTSTSATKYLNALMELRRPVPGGIDQIWLRHEPGRGITLNFPGSQGVGTLSLPSVQGFPIPPGQTREFQVGLQIDGPGVSQQVSTFWANFDTQLFAYKLQLYETDSPTATGGRLLASLDWNPGFTVDLVVLAFRQQWQPVHFGQDTIVDAVGYGDSPDNASPLIQLPHPARVQDILRAIEGYMGQDNLLDRFPYE